MKVLIIDDEPLIRRALTRVAQARGYEVSEAKDGLEAFELWKSFKPSLVFLDILMPGCSGPQLLEKLGKNHQAKVVLLSAYKGNYDKDSVEKLGANIFIQKPFSDIYSVFEEAEKLVGV